METRVVEWSNSKWIPYIDDRRLIVRECEKRGITDFKNLDEFFDFIKEIGFVRGDDEGHYFVSPNHYDEIISSRKAIKSAFSLSESERDGLSLVIGYITGMYGDDEDVAKYEAVRNSLSEDELKELENLLRYVIDAKQDVKVVKEANLKKDIPLLNKVYGILDENDLLDDSDAWYGFKKLESSHKQIASSKKQIESKLNFDKITDMCDDLDFSTLGYGRDPHGDMIAELDAIEGESGNIEGVEIRFTENDDGQTVIAVYKKDHKVDTMTTKLVDGEISRDDINEAVYDFLKENSQMLNSSRKPIKSSINTEIVKDFPAYMVYYATYGEPGGNVTDEDIAAFEKWRKRKGYGDCLGFVDDDPEQSFDSHPAFGLACDTVPVIFEVEKSIESSRKIASSRKTIKSNILADKYTHLDSDTGNDEKDNLYKKVEFTPKEMKAIREEAKRINYKPGMENSLIIALKKRNDGTSGSLYFKNREIWNKSGMVRDTEYDYDLIKKKIKSMNGNFDVDDDNDDVFQSRKPIKSSRKISSVRVNELAEQEKDDLYEIEKNEAEEYYNSLDNSDKQMLRVRYGIKNVKDYVKFFIVHPNKLSDDYEFMNDPRTKLNSHRPVKSGLDKETVSVDVNSLYHFLTDSETAEVEGDFALVRCDEDDGETYYDILSGGDLACMDGETCEIVGRGEGFVELHSIEADDGVNFKLSPEEFEVACGKSKKQIKSSLASDSFEMMVKGSRKMAEDMNSNLDDWWVTKQVGQDVVYFVAEHKDYSVRVRFEFVNSGFCYVSKTYTNGSYYEPVALESWKYEGLSSQEIEGKMTAVLNDFFPKYNEIGSSKKLVESSVDYEPLTKLLDDLGAYPESRMPPAGIYKRLLDWKVGSEGMDEKEAREKFGTFTVGEWIDDLKESVM